MSKPGKSNKKFQRACDQYFKKGHKEWSSFFNKWEDMALKENAEEDEVAEIEEQSGIPAPLSPVEEKQKRKSKRICVAARSKRLRTDTEVEEILEETKISFKFVGSEEHEEEFLSYLTEVSQKFAQTNPFLGNNYGLKDSNHSGVHFKFNANSALDDTVQCTPRRKIGISLADYGNPTLPYESPCRSNFDPSFEFDNRLFEPPTQSGFFGHPYIDLSPVISNPVSRFLVSPQRSCISPRINNTPSSQLALPPPESWSPITKPVFDVCTVISSDSEDESTEDDVSPARKTLKISDKNPLSSSNIIAHADHLSRSNEDSEELGEGTWESAESSDSEGIFD